jgi:signal peptidase I
MKVWGNDLKIGDSIWYESYYNFKHGIVKKRDDLTFRMSSLILNNGDRIFVNSYYYTEREDITNEVIDEVINSVKTKINKLNKDKDDIDSSIHLLEERINNLNRFKNGLS